MKFKKIANSKKFVEVHWVDSTSSAHWKNIEDVKRLFGEYRIVTRGYLIRNGRKNVSIASTIAEDHACLALVNIPRGCIKKIKVLN